MIIVETILPVFLLITLGYLLKRIGLLQEAGISVIKKLCCNVFLPVMAFDCLIHGTYSKDSVLLIGLEIFMLFAAFGIGFLFRPMFDEKIRGYVPYAMTTYEGGLFAWALISIAVGKENLYYIVSMDIFSGVFVFTIMATGLKMLSGQRMSKKEVVFSICTNPVNIAVVLGFIGVAFGLGEKIDNSSCAGLYKKVTDFFIQPMSPMILLCIGSGLVFDWNVLKKGLKLAGLRYAVQVVLCVTVLSIIYKTIGLNLILKKSLLIYFFVPSSFLLSMYATEKETVELTSSVLSLEILISLIIYTIISIMVM
ncbi:MAG: transporter [Treponema sp.]|nr:transporter [Treponema sp.]